MCIRSLNYVLIAILLFLCSPVSYSAIPTTIHYQGFLTDNAGLPVDGTVDITFRLYLVETGGESGQWEEFHSSVSVNSGVFNVELGSITPFPDSLFNNPTYLAIKIGADPYMTPRLKMSSVPYAFTGENLVACVSGETNCDGTCADLDFNVSHCGACDTSCHVGTQQCITGTCVCSAGLGNCDANAANGCETNVQTDNNNCGFCGVVCSGGTFCDSGLCCATGETNCNSTCTDTSSNISHCGACNNVCNNTPCNAGICDTSNCNTGFEDCDLNSANGCETDIDNDVANCGACNNVCLASEICSSGFCQCPPGETLCGGTCVDTDTDKNNCGSCGFTCNGDSVCSGSICTETCGDNILNQNETDIDCGGGSCITCENGQSCFNDLDCTSFNCVGNVCVP